MNQATITIGRVTYTVVGVRAFEHNGKARESLTLRRPNGSRLYYAIRYETGAVSNAV